VAVAFARGATADSLRFAIPLLAMLFLLGAVSAMIAIAIGLK